MAIELLHTINRGVEKRNIFLDDKDHLRFVHNLFILNDAQWAQNSSYFFRQRNDPYIDTSSRYIKPRERLVDIHAFCIMPNHYHLLLSPRLPRGVSRFMHKLNMAYAKYFNTKYKRTGVLFEGTYRSVAIVNEAHFIHLPYYIHLNPLDLIAPEWRRRSIKNANTALKFLNEYRWSSYLDYIGKPNFPSITTRNFLHKVFGGVKQQRFALQKWIEEMTFEDLKQITLE